MASKISLSLGIMSCLLNLLKPWRGSIGQGVVYKSLNLVPMQASALLLGANIWGLCGRRGKGGPTVHGIFVHQGVCQFCIPVFLLLALVGVEVASDFVLEGSEVGFASLVCRGCGSGQLVSMCLGRSRSMYGDCRECWLSHQNQGLG